MCAPPPAVQSALDQLPDYQTADQSRYEYLQTRRSAIRALIERYPGDIFVARAYIASMSNENTPADRLKVIAEYQDLHNQRPDDAYISYLYGISLLGRDTPQSIRLFTAALAQAPNFPWPHLQFVSIYSAPNFLDKAQAISHAKAFLAACPAAWEGYTPLGGIGDQELIRHAASQLRQVIQPRTDPGALAAYSTLWSLEFAAHPPSAYDALRKQVADDVAHLRALNMENVRQWWRALEEGYKLTNDEKQSDWAAGQSARRFPTWDLPEHIQWYEHHDYPGADVPADKKKAYYSDLLQQTDAWIKLRPKSYYIWRERLQALDHLDDAPAAEVASCFAKVLALAQADKGPQPLDSVTDFQLVWVLYNKKLQPRRQLELAQNYLEQFAIDSQQYLDDRYVSKNVDSTFWSTHWKFSAYFFAADAYVRLKQAAQARDALTHADVVLQALKSQINGKDEFRKAYATQESSYWLAEARLAQLQGHQLDAMAYYESALLARLDSGSLPAPGEKDDVAQDAHQLWARLGGSDESWKLWYTRRADAVAAQSHLTWENAQDPLPPFQLADLHGKTWQLADLKGKVAFLNFWDSS
ncbi:MAG: hypothetical protein ABSH50_32355 [Bryobacteraceae bacterium]